MECKEAATEVAERWQEWKRVPHASDAGVIVCVGLALGGGGGGD